MNAQTITTNPVVPPAAPAEKPGLYPTMETYFRELFKSQPHIDRREYNVELLRLDLQARFGIDYSDDEVYQQCKICFNQVRPGVFLIHRYDFNPYKN